MNVTLLSIDVLEGANGHGVEISVPRFRLTIERLLWKRTRWSKAVLRYQGHTGWTAYTPLLQITLEDWR